MKEIRKLIIPVFIFLMLVLPVFSYVFAETTDTGLVPCDNVRISCDFNQLMNLVNKVIKFLLFNLAVPIAAIMFVYAGVLMVSSGGSPESRTKAKDIFTNAALGLLFAAGAWLIIRTILQILGYQGDWIGF